MSGPRFAPPTFRRAFISVLVVLAVLVAAFATIDRIQGPKLSSAQVDTTAVVSAPAQSLHLFMSERVAAVKPAQVSISPAAPLSVSASGQDIGIQFTDPLSYATTYRVSVRGVTSADDGSVSTIDYQFTTAASTIYYLKRNGGSKPDDIIRTTIGVPGQTVAYSADRIQDFVILDDALAVVTLDASGDSSLAFVSQTGGVDQVRMPSAGTIDLVRGDSDTGILGFTFTSAGPATQRKYSSTLFTVSPTSGKAPKPVDGLDGKPLSVINWYFVPTTNDMAVQSTQGSVLLIDPANAAGITPFGSYLVLTSVGMDGKSLTVIGGTQISSIALALPSGKPTPIVSSKLGGVATLGGAAQLLPKGWLQVDSLYDAKTGGFTEHLVFDNGSVARELYATPNPLGSIDSFQGSPNNQYVSIETTPDVATAKPDGYAVDGRATSVTTVIVDIATGRVVKRFAGFNAQW